MKLIQRFCLVLAALFTAGLSTEAAGTELWNAGVSLIPYPQSAELGGDIFVLGNRLEIVLDKDAAPADKFAAEELCRALKEKWSVQCEIAASPAGKSIVLTRQGAPERVGEQGYSLGVAAGGITVRAGGEAGLFYGVQTLLQLIQDEGRGPFIKGMEIVDWPDIPERAVHYDTKHFQENFEYVKGFIRTLADYKINMLIWEWEDKFAYPSHPDLGAPGAFTMQEMQELTHFARKYHVQIVPLVQGLGHVSFILKHTQYKHLREIASDNWGFCPLREGTYELMFDLLEDAIQATPGSDYIHIGCDETYVLGKGVECGCQDKVAEIGRHGLLMKYIERCAERMKSRDRKVLSWGGVYDSEEKIKPPSELITFSIGEDAQRDSISRAAGYPVWIYDPNPGIEHLFLPYFYRLNSKGKEVRAHLEKSCQTMSQAALSGIYNGMVTTSWTCSGVHNQFWMLRYITAAEFTWSGGNPTREEFEEKFFANYYGSGSRDVKELYELLNRASYYYMETFERKVWHWGEVGKTNLPDLPRDDIEYDPFWNTRYKEMIEHSREQLPKMARVLEICRINQQSGAGNSYDFELFSVLAELIQHTANTYLALAELENTIKEAHRVHFDSNQEAFASLGRAAGIVEKNLAERDEVFNRIVTTWEKCQLPRGMSTPEKKYVHGRDQQRNFANRRPDLTFMIYDEQRLGLEEYLGKLRSYIDWYEKTYLQ